MFRNITSRPPSLPATSGGFPPPHYPTLKPTLLRFNVLPFSACSPLSPLQPPRPLIRLQHNPSSPLSNTLNESTYAPPTPPFSDTPIVTAPTVQPVVTPPAPVPPTPPNEALQNLLSIFQETVSSPFQAIHLLTGLPWWATLFISGTLVRLLMFPIHLQQLRLSAQITEITNEYRDKIQIFNNSFANGQQQQDAAVSPEEILAVTGKIQTLNGQLIRNTFKSLFFHGSAYIAIHYLISSPVHAPNLATGGTLWFTNLTAIDPNLIIPLIATTIFIMSILFPLMIQRQPVPTLLYVLALLAPPIGLWAGTKFSAAWMLYMLGSALYGFTMAMVCCSNRVRAFLKIPLLKNKGKVSEIKEIN